ncbi:MAG: ribonuclease P protein component [Cyclobacteriaceae bacterium]|nr:ribonuclease P protein component [Cyclobacteriaceae bacterium]
MKSFTFQKNERLNGQKEIERLFKEGKSLFKYPFKVYFRTPNGLPHSRILISVSRRNFKNAVDRNLIKRRIREVYRQGEFKASAKNYDLACVYIAKEIVSYNFLAEKLNSILDRLE